MSTQEVRWIAHLARLELTHEEVAALTRQLGDIGLRFRTLLRRLGGGLDGPGGFADADAWYCILEGTAEISVAEAQARALVDLLASFAVHGPGAAGRAGSGREILLAVDEFSAVSRRLPVWQLYERARSLGLAVQVSAQSWPGLAAGFRRAAGSRVGAYRLVVGSLGAAARRAVSSLGPAHRAVSREAVSRRATAAADSGTSWRWAILSAVLPRI